MENLIHYLADNRGIYIPQHFAESVRREYVRGITDDDYQILECGPDHEYYWETWDDVLRDARIDRDGITYHLHQDGDLWLYNLDAYIDGDAELIELFGGEY